MVSAAFRICGPPQAEQFVSGLLVPYDNSAIRVIPT